MKKHFMVALFFLISFSLIGCGNSKATYYEISKSEVVDVTYKKDENNRPKQNNIDNKQNKSNSYFSYKNDRFGFSADIPDYMTLYDTSYENNEITYFSDNGDIELTMTGTFTVDDVDIDDFYTYYLANMEYTPNFVEKNKNNCTVSWEAENNIYWTKFYFKSDNTINLLEICYPKEQELEDDIEYVLDSFKIGYGYDSYTYE